MCFDFVNVFLQFRNNLPLEKGGALHLNQFESALSKDALCQVWLKLAQWFWKENFQISPMYFRYFVIIFPLKRAWPFIWANLNPPSSKDDFCQVWWKLVRWFWRSWFSNFVNVFLLFRNNLPLEKGGALRIPFTQGCFVPSLI